MDFPIDEKIRHIVVLMFENRSFDHLFGALPGVNGVLCSDGTPNLNYYNTLHPTQQASDTNKPVYPTPIDLDGQAILKHDFNHDFGDGMMPDLFGPGTTGYAKGAPVGAPEKTYPPTNSGFLSTIAFNVGNCPHPLNGDAVMTYFKAGSLKVLHTLAQEFVICDKWHCDLPDCTKPNRAFMHCATTGNLGIDQDNSGNLTAKTIYEKIEEHGKSWKMYNPGVTGWLADSNWLCNIYGNPNANVPISQFCADVDNGELPFYSFLICWSPPGKEETSMHPAARVEPGENFLAAVYNKLRQSNLWENTLLVVNFDENGGIYDHVMPPTTVSPYPGTPVLTTVNNCGTNSEFDFTLLGPRIPAILISPWLAKGKIDSTLYQNTSILRFIQDMLPDPTEPVAASLTLRDEKANSIACAFDKFGLAVPRTDCPKSIEGYARFGGGNICDDLATDTTSDHEAPMPYQISVMKEYVGGLPGHADTGKDITREFMTNASLNRYGQQRSQAAQWHHAGIHRQASIRIFEVLSGQWIWQLRDASGIELASSINTFPTHELALQELDRVRFLFHELSCEP